MSTGERKHAGQLRLEMDWFAFNGVHFETLDFDELYTFVSQTKSQYTL